MTKGRVKTASVELIQNQIILLLLSIGLTSLLLLLYGIFASADLEIKFIETTLRITALFAFLFGLILPNKLGSVKRLYQLGMMRLDIFKTYINVALLYVVNTVTLVLFIGIILNVLPLLNHLNSTIEIETLIAIVTIILYIFGIFMSGVAITITSKSNILYAAIVVIVLVLTIYPLMSLSTTLVSMIFPIILIVISTGLLFMTLRAYQIK